jgi:hypothetical protein
LRTKRCEPENTGAQTLPHARFAGASTPAFSFGETPMPHQAQFAPGVLESWARKKYCELKPEDIDEEWMDLMVKRLFRELDRHLNIIEKTDVPAEPAQKAQVARALASMERSLGRLTRIEKERGAMREHKVAEPNDDKRAILERRLDKLAETERVAGVPDESK